MPIVVARSGNLLPIRAGRISSDTNLLRFSTDLVLSTPKLATAPPRAATTTFAGRCASRAQAFSPPRSAAAHFQSTQP
jgi:hypothetical protein